MLVKWKNITIRRELTDSRLDARNVQDYHGMSFFPESKKTTKDYWGSSKEWKDTGVNLNALPLSKKKRDNLSTKNMTNMDWNYEPVTTINLQYPLVSFGESRAVITLKIGEQRESGTYIGFSIKWNIRLRFPNDSHCLLNY